jgi:predicted Zn-dependent peptidase
VDKALAEAATMQFGAMDGTGAFCSYIRCSSENVAKVLDTVGHILENLAGDGVTEEELRAAKNKVLSELVIKNELPMGRLVDLGFNWIYLKQYRTIEDDVNQIKAVTVDDIHSLIGQFSPCDFTQLRLGPARNS